MKRTPAGRFKRSARRARDLERVYSPRAFAAKLRRLADALEKGERFRIQIAGERVSIPPDASITVEHEREGGAEEVEFQLTWKND
jgi:amphi-Trp domain-containing protein